MTDAKRVAKLEAQLASLRARYAARTDQLLLVLLQIEDQKKMINVVRDDLTILAGGRLPGDPEWAVASEVRDWAQGWLARLGA